MGARIVASLLIAAAPVGLATPNVGADASTSVSACAVVYRGPGRYEMVYPDGTGRKEVGWLPFLNSSIAWTHDRAWIATAVRRDDVEDELRIADRRGRLIRTIATPGDSVRRLVWSPDGRRLAFWAGDEAGGHVYVVGRDGRGLRSLTSPVGFVRGSVGGASWSPDGRRLLVTGRIGKRRGAVYTLGIDGKRLQRVPLPFADVSFPDWSPDGKGLAFLVGGLNEGIVISNLDGTRPRRLTSARGHGGPIWSPDGKYLSFDRNLGGDNPNDVYVVSADGGKVRRLTHTPYNYYDEGMTAAGWYCVQP